MAEELSNGELFKEIMGQLVSRTYNAAVELGSSAVRGSISLGHSAAMAQHEHERISSITPEELAERVTTPQPLVR